MGRIKKLLDRELVGGTTDEEIYPISSTKAIYDENNQTVDYLLKLYLDKLNKLFARQGYYVCDSISTEPDKEIQVNNFELSTTIRLLVRMSKANLATSVSFEVNTTGAYPLYYNGAPASPENTWEANEVLDIYFDGNFFQAFRSKGSDTDALWELRVDEEGNDYLYTDKNVVITKGLITYSSIAPIVPSIYEGIPFDNKTIWLNKETGVVEVIGGTGGGSSIDEKKLWEILGAEGADQIHESHIADILSKYSTTEKMWELLLANTEEQINISHLKTALSEFSSSEEFTGKYVTVDSKEQTIQGIKTFLNGLKIGEHLINVVDGVLYLDCSIAVTGGITAYAMGDRDIPTIMDGIVTDEQTITVKEIGGVKKLVVIGGTGGDLDEDKLWKLLEAEGVQQIDKSHLTTALNGYATTEQLNKKWTQDDVKISHWDEAYTWGNHAKAGYVKSKKVWGQLYDGVNDITGNMYNVGFISMNGNISGVKVISSLTTHGGYNLHGGYQANEAFRIDAYNSDGKWSSNLMFGLINGRIGIGTATPTERLEVNGNIKAIEFNINGKRLYVSEGVVYLDGDLAITGGLTTFALGNRSVSTIMDGINCDNVTIRVNPTTNKLEVIGGTGEDVDLSDYYTKTETDSKYITSIGIDGNNLTWTKNGTVNPITVPYASNSGKLNNYQEAEFFRRNKASIPDDTNSILYTLNGTVRDTSNPDYTGMYVGFSFIGASNSGILLHLTSGSSPKLKFNYVIDNNKLSSQGWKEFAFTDGTIENANHLSGKELNISGQNPYDKVAYVGADGVMEIGKYLDFHCDNSGNYDYNVRLIAPDTTDQYSINLPAKWGTLALLTDNVTSATKLETARYIWGKAFDGTRDISGDLLHVGRITFETGSIINSPTLYDFVGVYKDSLQSVQRFAVGGLYVGQTYTEAEKVPIGAVKAVEYYINGKRLYVSNGVIYLDGDLAVTGGITSFALADRSVSTIMDGINCDNTTIRVNPTTNKLEVIGGTGGGEADSVEWNNIKNKPSWIGSTKPTYNWSEIQNKPTWVTTTNPSYTKAESDSKYVTALGTSGNYLTWTKNGTTNNITIPYATNAGTLSGKSLHLSGQNPYGKIPFISGIDGGMEIGKFLDFHTSSDDNRDYAIRLQATNTTGGATVTLPSKTGTLALLTDNVASADKLATARYIWGQPFNGTKNITGNMSDVGSIAMDGSLSGVSAINAFSSNGGYIISRGYKSGESFRLDSYNGNNDWVSNSIVILTSGYVGIGMINPSDRFHVNGNARINNTLYVNGYSISKNSDGYLVLDGNIRVRGNILAEGGVTAYASSFEDNRVIDEVGGIKFSKYGSFDIDGYGNHRATVNSNSYTWSVQKYNGTSAIIVRSVDGHVGINTTTLNDVLTVGGNTRITGNLVVDGTISGEGIGGGSVDFSELTSNASTNLAITISGTRKTIPNLYAYKADELTTSRYIWGKSFNGSSSISGDMSDVGKISFSSGSAISAPSGYSFVGFYTSNNVQKIAAGGIYVGASYANTNSVPIGSVYATEFKQTSDIRKKNKLNDIIIPTDKIASAPIFRFSWKDTDRIDVGSSAQYWKDVLPDLVTELEDGTLSMNYSNIAVVCVVSLAKQMQTEITKLNKEIVFLKNKIKQIGG